MNTKTPKAKQFTRSQLYPGKWRSPFFFVRKPMPMNRKLYPSNWDEIAFDIKQSVNWTCEKCGKKCLEPHQVLEAYKRDRRQWALFTLTVHHIDHVPQNCDRKNLIALCSVCHRRQHAHDKKFGINKGQLSLI